MWHTDAIEEERLHTILRARRLVGPLRHTSTDPYILFEDGWRVFNPEADRALAKATYNERRESGVCTVCGAAAAGKSLCETCNERNNTKRRQREALLAAQGLCRCGAERERGYSNCHDCRRKVALARRKKRKKK